MKFVDHYVVLGLPTGEEGMKLTERQITKAFKAKALEVHPDKRPEDEAAAAHNDFQKLKDSYQILMDAQKRQEFHAVILAQQQQPGMTRSFRVVRTEPGMARSPPFQQVPRGTKRKNVTPDLQESERKKRQAASDEKQAKIYKNMKEKISAIFATIEKILKEDEEEGVRSKARNPEPKPSPQQSEPEPKPPVEKPGVVRVVKFGRNLKSKPTVVRIDFLDVTSRNINPTPTKYPKVQKAEEASKSGSMKTEGLEELFQRLHLHSAAIA